MKRTILIMTCLLGLFCVAEAQTIVDGVTVNNLKIERNGAYLVVDMDMDISKLDVSSNRAVLLTPRLVNGNDSIDLPSIGIYGRRRYYYYVRNGESMLTDKNEMSYRAAKKPDTVPYHNIFAYEKWMNGAMLSLYRSDYGCCSALVDEDYGLLGRHVEMFFPELVYAHGDVKERSKEGSAFVDFPVDKTVIYPEYRNNTVELGKIQASIDSVRNDRDVTITSVWLKGFASPESPYSHNTDLAIGRTAAVKKYIQQLYKFADGMISTDYEPENWEGLRKYVEKTNLEHRSEILALIDSDMEPDAKEAKIKRTYPEEYRFLLQNCYPALRRTDYRIDYKVRNYGSVAEIKEVMKTQPQKLSQDEFYLLAQEYEPGTEEFTEVFETAVRMFPNDTVANINAANAAMRRNDNAAAERYLAKVGDTPEAVYARGALAIRNEEYDKAREYLVKAKELGVKQAGLTLEQLDKGRTK